MFSICLKHVTEVLAGIYVPTTVTTLRNPTHKAQTVVTARPVATVLGQTRISLEKTFEIRAVAFLMLSLMFVDEKPAH